MSDTLARGDMPFLDHLEELRWRILWSLLAVAVGTAVGWLLVDRIDVITLLKRPIAPFLPGGQLMFTSPTEPFLLTLKVAFAVGCLLASPIVIYQAWAFLAPALYAREKRLIVPALAVGVVLFLVGAAAAYLYALPAALEVLFAFTRNDLAPVITIDRYFGFAIPFILAFGIVTELPLVIAILAALGLVTPRFLSRNRRYAIIMAAVVAALLTPPDADSMMMMLVPLLLLYEVSIGCAWIASRRRARRTAGTLAVLLLLGGGSRLDAQQPQRPPRPPPVRADTVKPDTTRRGTVDSATARRLGLPTGPTRSFPPSDRVIDSLLKLPGYRITRYVADTLVMEGDSQTLFLRREAFVERDGTQLEADSIRYREASCRLDAAGDPRLFDQGTVLVGEGMRYDTCLRRGTVRDALTDVQQTGTTWIVRGNLSVDSGQTRVYAGDARFTSDQQPVPDYHFAAGEVKWINKNTMVARPAVLYVRDVPVMWLPFIFQDIRSGRRSGILVPRFGLNDLVRTSRRYSRHVTNIGYYFAVSDYIDLLVSGDWYAGRTLAMRAQSQYRWLDRFMQGGISYTRTQELDGGSTASRIGWYHGQTFDSRTRFNAMVDYATSASVVSRNSLDPFQATATLASRASFDKRFSWGALNLGGSRTQELSSDRVSQTFPEIRVTPSAVNLTAAITWSPLFTYTNTQTFHNAAGGLLIPGLPGDTVPIDTLPLFADDRRTTIQFQTPFRIGRWNWSNSVSVIDVVSSRREEFLIPDSTDPTGVRRVLFGQTFRTDVDWQTGINLPPLLTGTWKLQPGIAILNTTSAGPFMLRNQFSGGRYVRQGKRLAFTAGMSPTFFGFFPGVGPLQRIRHAITPIVSYQYAPGAQVPEAYARALDPTGRTLNARSDPQQTITLSLSQNVEAKLRPPRGDTSGAEPRKMRLLSINTGGIAYNFEQAKQPGRVGWQTQSINNTFASDLLPGFSLRISHDLWRGQVGLDTTRFEPFLQSVSTSFSISAATLRGIGGLLGLGRDAPPPPPPAAPQDSLNTPVTGQTDLFRQYDGATPRDAFGNTAAGGYAGGGSGAGRGFALNLAYSSNRSRNDVTGFGGSGVGGRRVVTMNLSFAPTRNWTASWYTSYDFDTQQFAQHNVRLERDLRRWRASFVFAKSGNGNFVFSFNIALIDQSDIKFDYDQRTFVRP
ncbi:MAG: twin-arginine translocase subunit TatC [Gemmatimonadales bacterium]|nr:twin-arginine translocase subunit TatC [Gemmatimonadales bacterium]